MEEEIITINVNPSIEENSENISFRVESAYSIDKITIKSSSNNREILFQGQEIKI